MPAVHSDFRRTRKKFLRVRSQTQIWQKSGAIGWERSDSVKRRLSRRHLSVFEVLCHFIIYGGYTCEIKKYALTKAASISALWLSEGFLDRFRHCPHFEYFVRPCELGTKAALAKAASWLRSQSEPSPWRFDQSVR